MSVYDILMLIIFIGAIWFGFRKGLAWQVASLCSIILSYFVAVNFRHPVAALISAEEPWNQFAAMLILFLGTSLVVWTVFASFSRSIKKMNLGGFGRQAGAILGAVKGGVLCMLATVFAVSLFQSTANMVHNSKAGYYVVSGIRQFARFTPTELAQYLDPHLQNFDNSIGQTPVKRPLFESNTNGGNFVNQNNGFQNNGFQTNPANASTGVTFSNANTGRPVQQTAPNYYPGQFQTGNQQTQQSTGGGFGFSRPAVNQSNQAFNQNAPSSQNFPNNRTQPNNGNFQSTGFGQQQFGNQTQQQNNGQFNAQQQQQNGFGQQQFQQQQNGFSQQQGTRTITTGQNGWPEINTTINTKDLLQRGAETTAEMLRRAYDTNVQPR